MTEHADDALYLVGVVLIVAACALVAIPLALAVAGACCIALASLWVGK